MSYPLVDAAGKPVCGLTVNFQLDRGSPVGERTDASGVARIESLRRVVSVRAWESGSTNLVIPPPYALAPGETSVRIALGAARPTGGVLLDEFRRPLAGVQLCLRQGEQYWFPTTGTDGRFQAGVGGTGPVTVQFSRRPSKDDAPSVPVRALVDATLRPGQTDGEFVARQLPRDRDLNVRVLFPNGDPVPDVYVSMMQRAFSPRTAKSTGADGVARYTSLPRLPTTIAVVFLTNPSMKERFLPPAITTVDAETTEVDLRLRGGAAITGSVADEKGNPVACQVWGYVDGRLKHTGNSRVDGTFRLLFPPDTKGRLTIQANDQRRLAKLPTRNGRSGVVRLGQTGVRLVVTE